MKKWLLDACLPEHYRPRRGGYILERAINRIKGVPSYLQFVPIKHGASLALPRKDIRPLHLVPPSIQKRYSIQACSYITYGQTWHIDVVVEP